MILTIFSFGISWVIFAMTFVLAAHFLHGFHSPYIQSTFKIGFIIGFLDAALIKAVRVLTFEVPMVVMGIAIAVIDFLLIVATNQSQIGYYISGHKDTAIASAILGLVAFVTEVIKEYFRADIR